MNKQLEIKSLDGKTAVGYLYSYDGLGLVLTKSRELNYKEVYVIPWSSIVMIKPKKSNISSFEEPN